MKVLSGRKKKKTIIIVSILAVIVLVCAGLLIWFLRQDREQKKLSDPTLKEDYEKLQAEYKKSGKNHKSKGKIKDAVAWVSIPDTDFSYPVMQTKSNPQYYLHRDIYGNYSFYGTPFLDARCSLDSDELIIYGHNINGRRYFGYLQNYRTESFYKEHPYFNLSKKGGKNKKYEICSVICTDTHSLAYEQMDIYNDEQYKELAQYMVDNSLFKCEAAADLENNIDNDTIESFFHKYQFAVLSTCRTREGHDKRLLIVGCRKR